VNVFQKSGEGMLDISGVTSLVDLHSTSSSNFLFGYGTDSASNGNTTISGDTSSPCPPVNVFSHHSPVSYQRDNNVSSHSPVCHQCDNNVSSFTVNVFFRHSPVSYLWDNILSSHYCNYD